MRKKTYASVDAYIADAPRQVQSHLKLLRQIIRKHAPDAEEVISYNMPAYKFHGMLAYFAAFQQHYSLFAMPSAIRMFQDKLKGYKVSTGTIQFPFDKPLPGRLVTQIIKFRVQENLAKMEARKLAAGRKKGTKGEKKEGGKGKQGNTGLG